MKGKIFDIQRFSVHDGPGIRTTVFMKGCPLRCKWCHNPEGFISAPQLQFFKEKCIKCGKCNERKNISDAANCPTEALKICGYEMEPEELLKEVLKDEMFYSDKGGVTFSGGECMVQADFVAEMLKLLKKRNINTVIDTSGYVKWEEFEKTLENCDLYLYDIKAATREIHKEYTGVYNDIIIENLKKLSDCGKNIWIRVPVMPCVNDNKEEMTKIAEIVKELKTVQQLRLMPYHTLGKSKYETLGYECEFNPEERITKEQLKEFQNLFKNYGIDCEE